MTPAIVGPAQNYFQAGNVQNHKPFEATYVEPAQARVGGRRRRLPARVRPRDGTEVIGLMPPNLIANQVALYKNFLDLSKAVSTDTGQNAGFRYDEHTWGVASSLRFADVWFGAERYKTVGFLTEGPGGDLVAAIDITHPYGNLRADRPCPARVWYPPDANYGAFVGVNAGKPVDILWTKNSTDYAGLFGTWSVPAVANIDFTTSRMTFGAGINPTSLYNCAEERGHLRRRSDDGHARVDDGDRACSQRRVRSWATRRSPTRCSSRRLPRASRTTTSRTSRSRATRTAASTRSGNGSWATPFSKVLIDLNASAASGTDSPQPLYYSPAANGIGTSGLQVYALGSGSFYETSPTVSGWNVNRIPVEPPLGSGYNPADPGYTFRRLRSSRPSSSRRVSTRSPMLPTSLSRRSART